MNVDEAALLAAYDIEDIMCQHHEGGRIQRLARIQCAVVTAFGRVGQKPPASTGLPANPIKHPSAQVAATLTPVSDQPTDAALPPSVAPAAPPVAARLSPETTAGAPLQAGITSQPKAVLIPKAAIKPKSKPLDPRPGKLVGVVIDAPGTVLALDMKQLVAVGPKGDWDIGTRPVALIMERMRNGETFGDDVLAELGSMGTDTFRESRKRWATELAKVGVTFIHTKGVGCRIEVAQ